jgi:gliding motility-associated-like protein
MDSACVEIDVPIDSIKAVKMQLMSLATTRGKEGEKSNERNRPTSQELIASSEYSGPLEVAFYSNPTPAAQFYKWSIYHSTELIVTRNDKDIRYTFSEPGSYRVVCAVNNATCTSDSMEVTVAVAESYLAVPNVFTPNGDGKNDEFRVAYRSLRDFHIWVYNRWGKLVYESTDPAKGWDGNINGRPAAEGAYFYVVRALGTDAAKNASFMMKASYNKKKLNADESVLGIYQMSGDINLLRGK